ncbi:MAG TPA: hypothetical protein VFE78_13780 [Gemmataceae bacterium]|nr:hypothetical protein [Gemmataceae bacterium]
MLENRDRRKFLADVGKGMLVASVGPALAFDLGLASAAEGKGPARLTFGELEPLVGLMQDTPADKLLPAVAEKIKGGTELRTLVAAAGLANARTFAGHDYVGYHSFMALCPAYQMAQELPGPRQALPVLKVLYRNTNRMQEAGGSKKEAMHPVEPAQLPSDKAGGEALREATRRVDRAGAEGVFAALAKGPVGEAYNHLQWEIQDEADVHRVVLSWRAWVMLDFTGKEQAHTILRQSVQYCLDAEANHKQNRRTPSAIRAMLPKLLDQYKLLGRPAGTRQPDDAWVAKLAQTIYTGGRPRAAEAVAAALAEGMKPEAVGEAISLAANMLLLHDPGRSQAEGAEKPRGSVHGASVGVHAQDSANAWRNIARVSDARNVVASLIVGAYHTAERQGGLNKQPYPLPEHLEKVQAKDAATLLKLAEEAVKANDQAGACAAVHRYGELGHAPRGAFDLLLRYAVSEDGALHAEKYYRTVAEEFAATRPAFRWRHLVGLARVTASEYGRPAPGYADACRLLKV